MLPVTLDGLDLDTLITVARVFAATTFAVGVAGLLAFVCWILLHVAHDDRRRLLFAVMGALWLGPGCGLSVRLAAQAPTEVDPGLIHLWGEDEQFVQEPAFSPDGRWIAFTMDTLYNQGSIYILPREGRQPRRLTDGRQDFLPQFAPDGRTLYFASWPGEQETVGWHLMAVPFDPERGALAGPVRRVSVDGIVGPSYAVSPDGERVVYHTNTAEGRQIRVIPSRGGPSRTLAAGGNGRVTFGWADGETVLFTRGEEGGGQALFSASLAGGEPRALTRHRGDLRVSGDGRLLLRAGSAGGAAEPRRYQLGPVDGPPVITFQLSQQVTMDELRVNGTQLAVSSYELAGSLRVMPVTGGRPRTLWDGGHFSFPFGWGEAGSILVASGEGAPGALFLAPEEGGPTRSLSVPEPTEGFRAVLSRDGRFVLYSTRVSEGRIGARIVNLTDGSVRAVSENASDLGSAGQYWGATGEGGRRLTVGERFLLWEGTAGSHTLVAVAPDGERAVLREGLSAPDVAVHGDRMVWTETGPGLSTTVMMAEGPQGPAREVYRSEQLFTQPRWSHDGRRLAFLSFSTAFAGRPPARGELVVLPVGEDGTAERDPTVAAQVALVSWALQWLRDDSGILLLQLGGGGTWSLAETGVWLFPLDPSSNPVEVTASDDGQVWDFHLSPDGREIAYSSTRVRGSSLWLIDLGEWVERAAGGR